MNKKPEILSDDTKQSFEDAVMTPEEIEEDIAIYETMHGFSSEKLLEMQAEGTLPDTFEIQAWLILLQYRR
jgi:hypothetical protein